MKQAKKKSPAEDVQIAQNIKKGIEIDAKIRDLKAELAEIQTFLTEVARKRRGSEQQNSVKLSENDMTAVITFRESYELSDKADKHEVIGVIGNLYDRFFSEKTVTKTTKDLKDFITGKTDYGDEKTRAYLMKSVITKKETKPNVKFVVN